MKKVLFVVVLAFVVSLASSAQSFSSKSEDSFFKVKKSPLACGFSQNLKMDDKFSFVPDDENDTDKKRRKKKRRGRGGSSGEMFLSSRLGIVIPVGDISESTKLGFSSMADFFFPVSDNIYLGLSTGWVVLPGKSITIFPGMPALDGPAVGFIPVLVNGRYFFSTDEFKPYVEVSTGLYIGSGDADMGTKFGLTPRFGFQYGSVVRFGVEGSYNMIFTEGFTTQYIGLLASIAYVF